ncbi:MAG TPA: S1/P1 nuclease, partial [Planctomycetaceae bacterium]|nr:S1/P1 nuclease [Planctomycetaceae bacterium]
HKDRFHHSTWHYINQPLFLRAEDRHFDIAHLELNLHVHPPRVADESMNIVQTIRLARREIGRAQLPDAERALWLTWLFHTVGDLHQPLHSTTLIDAARLPDGDRGGNSIPTKQRGNLHALWDNFPGEKIQLSESRKRALTWLHDVDLEAEAVGAADEVNEEVWWKESHRLCASVVYDEEVRSYLKHLPPEPIEKDTPRLTLSEDYLKRGGHVSRVRILQAGLRLGAVLNELFP